ncbi:hypothetical protein [Chryseobacterium indoltheticum]|uniref:hypothetical protein n=1 Tax=Chryseobacterium indoltheticum TaxID=254 RepID=UPI003F496FF2
MALEQAQAALSTAQSDISSAKSSTNATSKNISSSEAAVATANAQIEAAKANVWKTSQDLKRYSVLVKDHSITEQQYEQALVAKQSADKQLQVLVDTRNQIAQQTGIASSQTEASSQQISSCRIGCEAKRSRCGKCKIKSFLYRNYSSRGWFCRKSSYSDRSVFTGRCTII